MIARSHEEDREWHERYQELLRQEADEMLACNKDIIEAFTKLCSKKGLPSDQLSYYYVPAIGVVAEAPNLVVKVAQGLSIDKEGLVKLRDLPTSISIDHHNPGYMKSDNFVLMASPIFRRGLNKNSNWTPRFVQTFWEYEPNGVDLYLALDMNRVKVNQDGKVYLEEDRWYGAQFSNDVATIPDGLARMAPPADLKSHHVDFLFASVFAVDISWKTNVNIKTFQVLEIKNEDVTVEINGTIMHPARYVHSEFDLVSGTFRHFDGAIQYFTRDEYMARRSSNFSHNSKSSHHVKAKSDKAFKLNGSIAVNNWVNLCCQFFSANPLMIEYFEGAYPHDISDALAKIRLSPRNAT